MTGPPKEDARPGRALLVVRNTFEHDARVLRAARTLARGWATRSRCWRCAARAAPAASRTATASASCEWAPPRCWPAGPTAPWTGRWPHAPRRAARRPLSMPTGGTGSERRRSPQRRRCPQRRGGARRGRGPQGGAPPRAPVAGAVAVPPSGQVGHHQRLLPPRNPLVVRAQAADRAVQRLQHDVDRRRGQAPHAGSAVIYDSHELWPDRNLRPEASWWLVLCEGPVRARRRPRRDVEPRARRGRGAAATASPSRSSCGTSPHRPRRRGGARLGAKAGRRRPGGDLRGRASSGTAASRSRSEALARADGVRLRLLGPVDAGVPEELAGAGARGGRGGAGGVRGARPPERGRGHAGEADVGLALFQPTCLSHRLVLPNKLFEYVLAGLPGGGERPPHDRPSSCRSTAWAPRWTRATPSHRAGARGDVAARAEPRAARRGAARARGDRLDASESEMLAGVYREALASAA